MDVIVAASAPRQVIEGDLAYDAFDNASEDEEVELFTCTRLGWSPLGAARTDHDGHFMLTLEGEARLGVGLHDLYASASADRTGVGFLAYVAAPDASIVVTDVDGTLTSSENAVVKAVIFGTDIGTQAGGAATLRELAHAGYQPVYLTARSRGLTEMTRWWLAQQGFPRGPIIMANGLTLPGNAALAHKRRALAKLRASGVVPTIAIGNRATDVAAYTSAGIPSTHVFLLATRYASELAPLVEAGKGVAFHAYAELPALVANRSVLPSGP